MCTMMTVVGSFVGNSHPFQSVEIAALICLVGVAKDSMVDEALGGVRSRRTCMSRQKIGACRRCECMW